MYVKLYLTRHSKGCHKGSLYCQVNYRGRKGYVYLKEGKGISCWDGQRWLKGASGLLNYILKDSSSRTYHRKLAKEEGRRAKRVWSVLFHPYDELFPDSSVGKESTCNAWDPGAIPGSGRSTGEGLGYPLQYSWAPLVAQLVKNLPAMWETWVWSLGWDNPLEKEKETVLISLPLIILTPGSWLSTWLLASWKSEIWCLVEGRSGQR